MLAVAPAVTLDEASSLSNVSNLYFIDTDTDTGAYIYKYIPDSWTARPKAFPPAMSARRCHGKALKSSFCRNPEQKRKHFKEGFRTIWAASVGAVLYGPYPSFNCSAVSVSV